MGDVSWNRLGDYDKILITSTYHYVSKETNEEFNISEFPQAVYTNGYPSFRLSRRQRAGKVNAFVRMGILEKVNEKYRFTVQAVHDLKELFPIWKKLYFGGKFNER